MDICDWGQMMGQLTELDEPDVRGYFDSSKNIFYIQYKGILSSDATVKAYMWLLTAGNVVGISNIRAFIFDFCEVTRFMRDNMIASQRQSTQANSLVDLSRIPAALVVKNIYQEQLVLLSMKVNAVEERSKICKSHAEALAFIDQFHIKLKQQDTASQGS